MLQESGLKSYLRNEARDGKVEEWEAIISNKENGVERISPLPGVGAMHVVTRI